MFVPSSECMNCITFWAMIDTYWENIKLSFCGKFEFGSYVPSFFPIHTFWPTYFNKSFWYIQIFLEPVQNSLKLLKNGKSNYQIKFWAGIEVYMWKKYQSYLSCTCFLCCCAVSFRRWRCSNQQYVQCR